MSNMVPAGPIRRLIEAWSDKHPDARVLLGNRAAGIILGNTGVIAYLVDLPVDYIKNIRNGRTTKLAFDRADRIVTRLGEFGGMGWHDNEELHEVYEKFDLSALDESLPTTRRAA